MEVTPHLILQEKTFHSRMRQKILLPTYGKRKKRTGRAFQLCRQHHTICDMTHVRAGREGSGPMAELFFSGVS